MKKLFTLCVAILTVLTGTAGPVFADRISLSLRAGPYAIGQDLNGFHRIAMKGFRSRAVPGNPLLPAQVRNILLPPDIIWSTLRLTIVSTVSETLTERFQIGPAAPDMASVNGRLVTAWGQGNDIVNGRNMKVYGENQFFPSECVKRLPYAQMRQWKYTKIAFWPFQVNPATGQLRLIRRADIDMTFERSGEQGWRNRVNDKTMDRLSPRLFQNHAQGKAWYASSEMKSDQPGAIYDYVIITTDAMVQNSTKLEAFIAHKTSRGFSVLVVTEADFDGLTGQAPNHRAEKIREWLINHYASYGIEYVLLIGDPTPYENGEGDIPMKMCWPRLGVGTYEEAPTDAFFADLTGNWDLDWDGYYGEWGDDTGSGGVDFAPEVWVGRIPVYNADYDGLDAILQKIMDYENETAIGWRKSILLPMSFSTSTYDGAPLAEQMMDDFLDPKAYFSLSQYQQGGGACGLNSAYPSDEELLGGTVVRDRWAADPYGIVLWWGHGGPTSASVGSDGCWEGTLFSTTQTPSLDDTHPAFTYQCSCLNGYPENSGNLQYKILRQGGIATVGATRVSWFNTGVGYGGFDGSSTNSGIGYEFVDRLTQHLTGGQSLFEAKLAVVGNLIFNSRLMNFYDFNLYGDPSVPLNASRLAVPAMPWLHLLLGSP